MSNNTLRHLMMLIAALMLLLLTVLARTAPNNSFDLTVLQLIQQHYSINAYQGAVLLAKCGGLPATSFFVGVMLVWQLIQKNLQHSAVIVISSIFTVLLAWGLKLSIMRPRPHFWVERVQTFGSSFPSAHSAYAILVCGVCVYLCNNRQQTIGHSLSVIVVVLWVGLMGWSRMYLGVHYLSDVLAGYCIGCLGLLMALSWSRWARAIDNT